jgi:aconitate hydratase
VVTEYLERAGLTEPLEALGFHLVGYGCTTCIGNSGPLPEEISAAVNEADLAAVSVLSGNRNFEGRINPDVKMNYLASPPLVVAYALAGTMDIDLVNDPIGTGSTGRTSSCATSGRTPPRWRGRSRRPCRATCSARATTRSSTATSAGRGSRSPRRPLRLGPRVDLRRQPALLRGDDDRDDPVEDITGARVLLKLGDSVTTDHISPAGSIKKDGPAGRYLQSRGVAPRDFNSYGSRRGHHEVMVRGTFANIRLRNQLAPGTEGGVTIKDGEELSVYEAAEAYRAEGTPLVVLGGKEYGSGSSRDWAAKGTSLLGIRAVIAESFERIHRSNLVGMGVLPLQFPEGETAESLGVSGTEEFSITGLAEPLNAGDLPRTVTVQAGEITFEARVRIDTPKEADYFRHGGILRYVLRQLAQAG